MTTTKTSTDPFETAAHHLRDPRERPLDAARVWAEELADDPAPDVYGDGALIADFEKEVATLVGKEAGVFLPSGILAQQIALRIHCERRGRFVVAYHPRAHLEDKENRALEVVHHLRTTTVGSRNKLLSLADLEVCKERLGALVLELGQRELGGELPTWEELDAQADWAAARGAALHLDGARVWEAIPFYGRGLDEICARFETVYLSFYKGLDGVAGAMLVGDQDFIDEARIWQKRLGGNLIHLWPLVVSARRGFRDRLPKMAAYVARTLEVAKLFDEAGAITRPKPPRTPLFHAFFAIDAAKLSAAARKLAEEDGVVLFTRATVAEVPGFSRVEVPCFERALVLDDEQIRTALEKLQRYAAS